MRYYNINNALVTHKTKHNTIWLAAKLTGLMGWVLRIGGAANGRGAVIGLCIQGRGDALILFGEIVRLRAKGVGACVGMP